jgi:hypothetical protein
MPPALLAGGAGGGMRLAGFAKGVAVAGSEPPPGGPAGGALAKAEVGGAEAARAM